jgi:serine/threonine protein phosphatase 1
MRIIAISDIHGHNSTFKALLNKTGLTKDDELVILGDCIDRGPDSKGVLDTIIRLQQNGYHVKCILGNHEDLLLRAYYNSDEQRAWSFNGGIASMKSFGVRQANEIPPEYIEFLESLELKHESGNTLFVHAGLNMQTESPFQDEYAMLWISDWYDELKFDRLNADTIIHGHMISTRAEIELNLDNMGNFPVMCIDNGCYCTKPGFNHLCAFDLTNRQLYFNKNVG